MKTKKILIVEDEISLRELYTEVLKEAEYEVDEAGDGESALEKISTGDWDALLLDIMLPKLDGVEILKKIKTDSLLSFKPVIVLSNLDNSSVVKDCMSLGAKDYLVKSNILPQKILDSLDKCFENE